jgi:putative thiamine transport system ATP-binding protein
MGAGAAPLAAHRRDGVRLMLDLDSITIATPERVLMRGLSAQVAAGDVLVVMGESGSGKSSLLSMLIGALPEGFIASGRVRLNGRDIAGLPTPQRRIGMLFQDDLLFPHMSVIDNLLFALPDGAPRADRVAQAEAALRSVGLDGHGARTPHSLSGGQRSRVSVLRALLARPEALLLDEPFSRLDAALRRRFRAFVFERIRDEAIPALLVTHDPQDIPPGAQVIELKPEREDA